MVEWHAKSKTKRTGSGGRRMSIRARDKKLTQKGGLAALTRIEKIDKNEVEGKVGVGNTSKNRVMKAGHVNVRDPKTNQYSQMELVTVKENMGNRDFARRNIITKNALLEVKSGDKTVKVRVLSRPGQNGSINAVLTQ